MHEPAAVLRGCAGCQCVTTRNHTVCYPNRHTQTALHKTLAEESLEVLKLRMSVQNKIKPIRTEAEIIPKGH